LLANSNSINILETKKTIISEDYKSTETKK